MMIRMIRMRSMMIRMIRMRSMMIIDKMMTRKSRRRMILVKTRKVMIMRKREMTKILIMDENEFLPAGVTQKRWKELIWLSLKTKRLASLYDQTELP